MTKHPMEDDRDWKAEGEARVVKPERELLQRAREGDELAAQELLLWPQWFPQDFIDPEVYEAIVGGALAVAAYVANECKSPKPTGAKEKENVAKVRASMFFNGATKIRSTETGKNIEAKSARIGFAVANGAGDPECLTEIERRVALTREFAPMMKGKPWEDYLLTREARQRPKLIRDAEARLVEFIRWKYSPHQGASSTRDKPLDLDEELCKSLVAISFPEIQWHRDANMDYVYPKEWN